ncbi:MAG: GGDEF domain-containing protein [Lachnospiraceae bacterium]|nr:GGDEF domain-containing protein [Lachnospiraceae bacterium]
MKKIALFVGEVSAEYQSEIAGGIIEEARKQGYSLHIFNNYGSYSPNVFRSYGEKSIIHIADLTSYDGVILAGDTFNVEGMYEELTEMLQRNTDCPVICLRREDPRFHSILAENYEPICNMVEHFVQVHGFRHICFMSGKREMKDAQKRLKAYRDTMEKHGLPVTDHMIFHGNYWKNMGEEALDWFLKDDNGDSVLPQVIVCANDYMAISICSALQRRGIQVPGQVCVSGFDDVEEARVSVPSMTSIKVNYRDMGRKAMCMLENLWQGRDAQEGIGSVEIVSKFRGSCGCAQSIDDEAVRRLYYHKELLQNALYHGSAMYIDMENTDNFRSLMNVGRAYVSAIRFENIYICMCDEQERQEEKAAMMNQYTEHMVLRNVMNMQEDIPREERFLRRELLPAAYRREGEILYIGTLHEKNDCFGYVVLTTDSPDELRYQFQTWMSSMSMSLARLQMYEENQALNEIRQQYGRDELTGIPNRREMERVLQKQYDHLRQNGESFFVVSVDMDGLKYINDHFGHLEGDVAIRALAGILAAEQGEMGVAARTGGDEFQICMATQSQGIVESRIAAIRRQIEQFNARGEKPYELSASIGYARCDQCVPLLNCLQQADKNMYQEKSGKKHARKPE